MQFNIEIFGGPMLWYVHEGVEFGLKKLHEAGITDLIVIEATAEPLEKKIWEDLGGKYIHSI